MTDMVIGCRLKKRIGLLTVVAAVAYIVGAGTSVAGITLKAVKAKGYVQCGVHLGLPGFSNPNEKGHWVGIDVDVCRAIAAGIFGDATKVKFRALSAKERFTALQSGEVDVLSRNTTWTDGVRNLVGSG